jgi:hypothetical protein
LSEIVTGSPATTPSVGGIRVNIVGIKVLRIKEHPSPWM